MKSDIEIAQEAKSRPIAEIAAELEIPEEAVRLYGKDKAKISHQLLKKWADKQDGKLVLVTAMHPTPYGEGKTTVSVGLADGLRQIGKKSVLCLREPSLGPVFGIKGGAAGGGHSQVVPMEDINLHFTGDFHAISAANNLLAALIDNHIHQGNALRIDPTRISWKRCIDMNDRALRNIVVGLGGASNGTPREDHFDIVAASEIMAVICLAQDIDDLKERLGRMVIGQSYDKKYVTVSELGAEGALALLLKDVLDPNLVQTLERTPAFVHGGPFANIAHGCNTLTATKLGRKLGDYCITEAGFGSDLGAEKFLDIKCRFGHMHPDVVVLVATVRALTHHGGREQKKEYTPEELLAFEEKGLANLFRHVENLTEVFHLPVVVAINQFATDTKEELGLLAHALEERGIAYALANGWAEGGAGCKALAQEVVDACERSSADFAYLYDLDCPLKEKMETIAKKIYRAGRVQFERAAANQIKKLEREGYGKLPICVAKTQYSFTDDQKALNAPEGFTLTIRDVHLSAGAGFIVMLTGSIMTMPGLGKEPAAMRMDVSEDGTIAGLF